MFDIYLYIYIILNIKQCAKALSPASVQCARPDTLSSIAETATARYLLDFRQKNCTGNKLDLNTLQSKAKQHFFKTKKMLALVLSSA